MVVAETKSEGSRHEEKSHRIVRRESPGPLARRHGASAVAAARRPRRRKDRVLRALPHSRAAGVPDTDGTGPHAALRAEERPRPRPPGVSGWQCAERGRARWAPHRAAPLARPQRDGRGLFVAEAVGSYVIRAKVEALETTAEAEVTKEPASPPPPAERGIAWRGKVPAQKWMNFYTKVVARFVSAPGLELEVQLVVPPSDGVTQGKAEEARSALRELGLNEDLKFK